MAQEDWKGKWYVFFPLVFLASVLSYAVAVFAAFFSDWINAGWKWGLVVAFILLLVFFLTQAFS